MLIDWFTVVAQAVNFLILVWLLKRFLYQPILDAIDARERRIAKVLADADMQKAAALQERDTFQRKNQEFDQQRNLLLQQMTDEVAVTRRKLLDDARQAADAFSAKRRAALQRELGEQALFVPADLADVGAAVCVTTPATAFFARWSEEEAPGLSGRTSGSTTARAPAGTRTSSTPPRVRGRTSSSRRAASPP